MASYTGEDRRLGHSTVTQSDWEGNVSSPIQAESDIERYGGDEPYDPKELRGTNESLTPTAETSKRTIVDWDGPDDKANPQNWSLPYKLILTLIFCLLTVNTTFASSSPSTATAAIAEQFSVSEEVTELVTALYLCGFMLGPILWAPASELFGRKPAYIVPAFLFFIFNLGQALAQNIQTLLITRFLCGAFASAPLVITSGYIVDLWGPVGRGIAACVFTGCVFLGPAIGPIVGGFIISSQLGWRWVFWVIMITSGTGFLATVFCLPETFAPVLLQKKAQRLRKLDPVANANIFAEHENNKWSFEEIVTRCLSRPIQMLFVEPILLLITIYMSLVYGILYALFEAFPLIFMEKKGLTLQQTGLTFISVGIGAVLGCIISILLMKNHSELVVKWRGFPPPEESLYGAIYSGPLVVISILWVGWTGNYPSVPWYVPAIGAIPFGISIVLVFISCSVYMMEVYLMYSASAFAANTIVRSGVAAGFPLFIVQMYEKLGVNWASTLLACLALVLAPSPFLFFRYGAKLRQYSKFAPCLDLKIAKELKAEEEEFSDV